MDVTDTCTNIYRIRVREANPIGIVGIIILRGSGRTVSDFVGFRIDGDIMYSHEEMLPDYVIMVIQKQCRLSACLIVNQ